MEERASEEIEALRGIYGDDNVDVMYVGKDGDVVFGDADWVKVTVRVSFVSEGSGEGFVQVGIGKRYPEVLDVRVENVGVSEGWLGRAERGEVLRDLRNWVVSELGSGEVVVFSVVEKAREALSDRWDSRDQQQVSKTPDEMKGDGASGKEMDPNWHSRIYHGETVIDRKSVFQAHVCFPCDSTDDVDRFMDTLLTNRKIQSATHNILAYRISSPTNIQDYDDDGETAAGKRLLSMLQSMRITHCAVVVTRWYGVRHSHPENPTSLYLPSLTQNLISHTSPGNQTRSNPIHAYQQFSQNPPRIHPRPPSSITLLIVNTKPSHASKLPTQAN